GAAHVVHAGVRFCGLPGRPSRRGARRARPGGPSRLSVAGQIRGRVRHNPHAGRDGCAGRAGLALPRRASARPRGAPEGAQRGAENLLKSAPQNDR
ncbi:MAG: hypothetical protein ACREJP_10460, partial [Candidatus Methylomirabilales bacterium]